MGRGHRFRDVTVTMQSTNVAVSPIIRQGKIIDVFIENVYVLLTFSL